MLISHCYYSSPPINSWLAVSIQYNVVLEKENSISLKQKIMKTRTPNSILFQMQFKLDRSINGIRKPPLFVMWNERSGLYGNSRPARACGLAAMSVSCATHGDVTARGPPGYRQQRHNAVTATIWPRSGGERVEAAAATNKTKKSSRFPARPSSEAAAANAS